jgi:hypothetical protein
MNQATRDNLLAIAMSAAVPLHIMQLQEKGGPDAADMKKAQETSDMLGERGDVLLFGGGKTGEPADLFNRTAHTVAVLAFVPGGIDIFGQHFEAIRQGNPDSRSSPIY